MSHWFDDFSKRLVRDGSVPRRSFLQLVAAVAGTSLVEGVPLTGRAFAQASNCAWRRVGNALNNDIVLRQGGLTFQRLVSYDIAQQTGRLSITVTKGSILVGKVETNARRGGPVTSTTTYGPAAQGAKNVTITSTDGRTFSGEVDGRAFTMQNRQMVFADGQPAPKIILSPNDVAAFNNVRAQAARSLAACRPTPPPGRQGGGTTPPVRGRSGRGGFTVAGSGTTAPGQGWYSPFSEQHVSCLKCTDDCSKKFEDQTVSFACIFGFGSCYPAAFAEWVVCMAACHVPGGGCLPNPCGSFTSCAVGDKCFDFNDGKLCCSAPAAVCNNVCCGTGVTTCAPDGSCGCSTGQIACGNGCCDGKTGICSNGICCPKGQVNHQGTCCTEKNVCGQVCCDEISGCADPKTSLCCGFATPVCAGKCCKLGETCVGNNCCPQARSCGGICCPSGQICTNPKTKTCGVINCKAGNVPCVPEKSSAICCPPKIACCPGKCCKPGEVCNLNKNGKYGCGPQLQPS